MGERSSVSEDVPLSTHTRIAHIFNSSSVSGPEALVIPSLSKLPANVEVLNLGEERLVGRVNSLEDFCARHATPHHLITVRSRLDWSALRELRQWILEGDFKIIHAHDAKASLYTLLALIGQKGGPILVSTHHGVIGRPDLTARFYEQLYSRCGLPFFDCVTVVSSYDRDILLKRGLSPQKVICLPNGVDRRLLSPEEKTAIQRTIRTSWGLAPSETFVLGVVARLSAEKNHERLLTCLAELQGMNSPHDWVVLCFGDGSLKSYLEDLTERLNLTQRVRWMGYRAEVGEEFGGFDLLLSFSKGEGQPISFLEAGWAGTPVFASSTGGIPELLSNGTTGFLFDLTESDLAVAQRLSQLLSERDNLQQIGLRFQKEVRENFSGEAWRFRLTQLYRSLLQGDT